MNLFMRNVEKQLKARCDKLEGRNIELRNLNDELEDKCHTQKIEFEKLERTKKIEEEEIAHRIKCREETTEIEKDKAVADAERKADRQVMKVKGEYQDKLIAGLEKRGDELRTMYTEILARLPEVNVEIGGSTVKTKKK